jgi:hypothetical protein
MREAAGRARLHGEGEVRVARERRRLEDALPHDRLRVARHPEERRAGERLVRRVRRLPRLALRLERLELAVDLLQAPRSLDRLDVARHRAVDEDVLAVDDDHRRAVHERLGVRGDRQRVAGGGGAGRGQGRRRGGRRRLGARGREEDREQAQGASHGAPVYTSHARSGQLPAAPGRAQLDVTAVVGRVEKRTRCLPADSVEQDPLQLDQDLHRLERADALGRHRVAWNVQHGAHGALRTGVTRRKGATRSTPTWGHTVVCVGCRPAVTMERP